MQNIEIDFDVYKEITVRRISEEMTPNDVLRSLLGLPVDKKWNITKAQGYTPWVVKGVEFPIGTKFRGTYKGKSSTAIVCEKGLQCNGEYFTSPSAAAVAITGQPTNGWTFWECQLPGSPKWTIIKKLRNEQP